jgi:hypothetical protein
MAFAQIGHSIPLNNIDGSLVNIDNSHYSGSAFTSRVIPSTVNPAVLPEPLNNRQAANSFIPGTGTGTYKGGSKNAKKKFKNIYNMYKMTKTKRRKTLSKLKKKYGYKKSRSNKRKSSRTNKRHKSRSRSRSRAFRGGYSQYQSNVPMTQTYSLGGPLSPNDSALANPAPYHVLSNCTNCVDNYNHFTNKGFPSKGSY